MGIFKTVSNIFKKFGEGTKSFSKVLNGILDSNLAPTTKQAKIRELEKVAIAEQKPTIIKMLGTQKKKLNEDVKEYKMLNYKKKLAKEEIKVTEIKPSQSYIFQNSVKNDVFVNPFFKGEKYVNVKIQIGDKDYINRTVRFNEIPDDRTFLAQIQNSINIMLSGYGIDGANAFTVEEILT
jgi:hypothetical protein